MLLCMPARPPPCRSTCCTEQVLPDGLLFAVPPLPDLIRSRCSAPGLSAPGTASLAHPDRCPFVRRVADYRLINVAV